MQRHIKNKVKQFIPIFFILLFVGIFFRQTLLLGKLPVPSDTLVGMYHPWLDWASKEYSSGMPFKNFLITDPVRQQIPWRKLAIESIRRGDWNAWNPYSFSGTPLSANIQSGFYYPPNIIFFILPFPIAWTVLIILQPLFSGLFLYLFLKLSVKLNTLSSLFGAFCFMFSGFSVMWLTWGTIGHTFLWLPLILLMIDAVRITPSKKKKFLYGGVLALSLSLSYFAGHSQIFLYVLAVSVAYTVARIFVGNHAIKNKKITIITLIMAITVCVLITSIHWVPFLKDLPNISRVQESGLTAKEGFFIPFQHLTQFLVPDFFGNPATLNYWGVWNYAEFCGYIGVAGLLFALFSLSAIRRKQTVFWLLVAGSGMLVAVPSPVSELPYTLKLPIISSLQPTRLLSIVDFSLCMLAAMGFEVWIKEKNKRYTLFALGVIGILLFCIWYTVKINYFHIIPENLDVTARNIIFPTVIFGLVSAVAIGRIVIENIIFHSRNWGIFNSGNGTEEMHRYLIYCSAIFCIGIAVFDLTRFGWKFTPFTDRKLFFPKTELIEFLEKQPKPFRIMAVDDRIMPPNVSSYYSIESVSGYDPLYDSRYEVFIAAMERGEPNITPPYGFNRIITPKNITSPLFRLLGIRYILTLSELSDSTFKKVFQEGQTRVYEKSDMLPRVYMAEEVIFETNPQKIFEKLYSPTFFPQRQAIIEEPLSLEIQPIAQSETVEIMAYTDRAVEIKVQAHIPRLLSVGNTYHRGWKATIDGDETPILPVNYIFMGLVVPEGMHTIRVQYE